MHGEQGYRRQSQQNGIGVQQAEEGSGEVALVVQRDALGHVPHGYADEEGGQEAADGEGGVPPSAPPFHGLLAPEFNGDGPEDQGEQQEHEGQVEPGENGGVHVREGGKEGAAARDEPDFIAVPHGADGIQREPSVFISLDEKLEGSCSQVKAVQDGVSGKEHADEDEPDDLQVCESEIIQHGFNGVGD